MAGESGASRSWWSSVKRSRHPVTAGDWMRDPLAPVRIVTPHAYGGLPKGPHIYALRDPDGLVKIGYTEDLRRRISELQTGNPRPLLLLGHRPGTQVDERQIHHDHADDRVAGEWFIESASLMYSFWGDYWATQ